jgi:chromosome segregation ATPase
MDFLQQARERVAEIKNLIEEKQDERDKTRTAITAAKDQSAAALAKKLEPMTGKCDALTQEIADLADESLSLEIPIAAADRHAKTLTKRAEKKAAPAAEAPAAEPAEETEAEGEPAQE